jgi:chromosomal replication initiator protein
MRRLHLYIMKCVCDQYKITRDQLSDSQNKAREIAIPRQIAVYLIKKYCLFTDENVSDLFHMNGPAWAFAAKKSITALMETDRRLDREVKAIERRLPYPGESSKF